MSPVDFIIKDSIIYNNNAFGILFEGNPIGTYKGIIRNVTFQDNIGGGIEATSGGLSAGFNEISVLNSTFISNGFEAMHANGLRTGRKPRIQVEDSSIMGSKTTNGLNSGDGIVAEGGGIATSTRNHFSGLGTALRVVSPGRIYTYGDNTVIGNDLTSSGPILTQGKF